MKQFPVKLSFSNMTTRVLVIFIATFVSAGLMVYFFENAGGNEKQFTSIWDGIWWGITTITTTGYGDKYPITFGGRLIAGFTMCSGIVMGGVVTGNLASWLVDRRLKEGRGIVNLAGKSGHLVICGWKREMATVIEEILLVDTTLKVQDIVIIAPISQETMENFKHDERFTQINIVRGDYYTQTMLDHGSVRRSKKVLILADWSDPTQSITSVDAKTVMTAMTIRKFAPEIYIAAELIDPKFNSYLHLAHCDEVMPSKEYARVLLANCTKTTGLAHVMYDLLSIRTATSMMTVPLPTEFVGKSFAEVVDHFRKGRDVITIGLLENTGSYLKIKKEALADAQKDPDTMKVLQNVMQIRHLKSNHPVLNPRRDYVVRKNSMAIVVGQREVV